MKIRTSASTTNVIDGVIEGRDIADMIRTVFKLPAGADVTLTVQVPSGGDYSGTKLVVGDGPDEQPIAFRASWANTARSPEQTVRLSAAPPAQAAAPEASVEDPDPIV